MDRNQYNPKVGYGSVACPPSNDYGQCEAISDQLTTQIVDRLDQALKVLDMLNGQACERADRLIGPVGNKMLDSTKCPPPTLDRGIMDRIVRQTKEVMVALEYLEQQLNRFNQL